MDKRRIKVLLITVAAAFLVVVFGFGCKYAALTTYYQAAERHAQMYAVSELSDSLAGLSDTLAKGQYAVSPELMTAVSTEIWNHSAAAIASLASLPLSDISLEKTETFISRAGDYAGYLARCAATSETLDASARRELAEMAETAEALSRDILLLEGDLYSGDVSFETDRKDQLADAVQRFSDVETAFPESTLADYDGIMSAHVARRTALLTEGEADMDHESARAQAALALDVDATELEDAGESDGQIPAYTFHDGNGGYAAVSRVGGYVISMNRRDSGKEGMTSIGQALHTAKDYLDKIGYPGLSQIYYHLDGNTAVFRFAYRDDEEVLYYPDLVLVGVSLSDGRVVSLDAAAYVMNHHERDTAEPTVGHNKAAETIAPDLDAVYTGLAVIHSPGMQEVLCHEFLCKTEDGQRLLIYCNAATGSQCKIAMIHEDENGVFLT